MVSEAIIAETASKSRFNSIDVDFKRGNNDVLFVGTGKIKLKFNQK